MFVEPEDPGPPSAADVKETLEPQEVVPVAAAGGKVEQERWRFSASELISKLQLSQRRNNFTAKIGKSLSTKITLREKGSSTSQEGGYTAAHLSILYIIIIMMMMQDLYKRQEFAHRSTQRAQNWHSWNFHPIPKDSYKVFIARSQDASSGFSLPSWSPQS